MGRELEVKFGECFMATSNVASLTSYYNSLSRGSPEARFDPSSAFNDEVSRLGMEKLELLATTFNSKSPRNDLIIELSKRRFNSQTNALAFLIGRKMDLFPLDWVDLCDRFNQQISTCKTAPDAASLIQDAIDADYVAYLDEMQLSKEEYKSLRKYFHPEKGDFGAVEWQHTPTWYKKEFPLWY